MRFAPTSLSALLACGMLVGLTACGTSLNHPESIGTGRQADFSLTASASTLNLTSGAAGQAISVTATAIDGFSGSVDVTLSGLPSGVTASPATLTLTPGMAQSVTLTASASAAANTSTVTFTGTSGNVSHTAALVLTVAAAAPPPPAADFSLAVAPGSLALTAGASGQPIAVTATAVNGFTGSVNVSLSGLPAGVTASPSALTLTPGTAQSITLTASSKATASDSTITLTGTSGGLSHTAALVLSVAAVVSPPPAADFSLAIAPGSLGLTSGAKGQAIAVTATALNGFTGSVHVSLSGLPAGVTASPAALTLTPGTAQSITLTASSKAAASDSTITLTGTSGGLSHTAALVLSVAAAAPPPPAADFSLAVAPGSLALTAGAKGQAVAVTATAVNGFTGSVNVTLSGLPAGVTANPATLVLTPGIAQSIVFTAASNATIGQSTVTLTGTSGSLSHVAAVGLTIAAAPPAPDFSLTAAPKSLALTAGTAGQTVAITANALNGFTGNVSIAWSGLPGGVTANPATPTLTPGNAQSVTLTAAANAAAGSATVTVTGTSGSLSHSATVALSVNAQTVNGIDVTTYHYDNARDGLNASETTLTPANVNATSFGKIASYITDGKVDAAPLYLSAMSVGGQTHNVLYVVSEHDSVYAFDADSGLQLWKISVLGANETTSDAHACGQITPEIGITATPVIDRSYGAHGAIFVVSMSEDAGGNYHQRLHALDLTTGAELSGGPTEIQATYPGNGAFSNNGLQTFEPGQYTERVGLLLMNGTIYMGWTSHCDQHPYTGWLMAYSEQTLQQTSVLNLTPNSGGTGFGEGEGSIWMSGDGLAGDASGNVYFLDANGGFDATLDANGFPIHQDYGNAFMKVSTASGRLAVADYFNTSNTVTESNNDIDLGSGGEMLLPDLTDASGQVRQLAVGAGKDRTIYVVDRTNMGKFNASTNQMYEQVVNAFTGSVFSTPAWFNGTIYYGANNDNLKAFKVTNAQLGMAPSSLSLKPFSYPGPTPSISANGTRNGIVWAVENGASSGVLHAYDAGNLANELYNSSQAAGGRDNFADNKFITPVVANGKVFVGTPTGVAVFGLLSH